MAGATDRSLAYAARHGFGLMLSTLPSADTLAKQIALYRGHLKEAPAPLDRNPAAGKVDIARWVYVADTDAAARRDTEQGIVRHISHFTPCSFTIRRTTATRRRWRGCVASRRR
jgi:alkanesulfonate monooxygenase SsuD/methylene tetrahydromethanopterin reductase-like flavin-dependent oxidoreductase (luciferase family)